MSPRRPRPDTLLSLRATLQRLELHVSAEDYADLKHRVLNRIADLELKQALADQAPTAPLVSEASIETQPSTAADSQSKSPTNPSGRAA
jgi:hypothetical protein